MGWAIAQRHHVCTECGLDAGKLGAFLQRVEGGYKDVPYHNAVHAACVTHGVYHLLTQRAELCELFGSPFVQKGCRCRSARSV